MGKKVLIKHESGREESVDLLDSNQTGMNHHVPQGSDGFHFKSYDSVERFFKRQYPNAEIEIDK